MKKLLQLLLASMMILSLVACSNDSGKEPTNEESDYKIAMVTDYGDITDESFNQATYEACRDFANDNSLKFEYFKPASDNDADRVAMIEKAIDNGYNIIVTPGFAFANALAKAAPEYPDVKFVALDVSKDDLAGANNGDLSYLDTNIYSMVYQEEISGYMAGYATVKMGYKELGFLGGMALPAVQRFGYGYVQGAEEAAKELNVDVNVKFAYGNQFFGDADITAAMDTWYGDGTEIVFACGGGIYTSAVEAAVKANAKVIGVDVDQSKTIDSKYGEGLTITSATKGLYPSTITALTNILDGKWESMVGKVENLGLIGEDSALNYVGLPLETTVWNDSFTQDDYKALVSKLYKGELKVSNDIASEPTVEKITVNYLGNLK